MSVPTVWVALCLASSAVMAASLDKPSYDLDNAENLFKDYLKQHGKIYNRGEYLDRLEIFKESLKDINSLNEKYPLTVFKVNHFSDLTSEELEQYRGVVPVTAKTNNAQSQEPFYTDSLSDSEVPEFDWRKLGVISHVKDQGPCGAGYIFSVIGSIEAGYAMKYRHCILLSESQILDCSRTNKGCKGGNVQELLHDILVGSIGRLLMKEKDYPYYPGKQTCRQNKTKSAVVLEGIRWGHESEDFLLRIVINSGPTAVALSAADFKHYAGGILEPNLCTNATRDHYVLVVGYGEENGEKFWIMKNSYGPTWGEKGYVRLRRGVKACGIDFAKYGGPVTDCIWAV